MGMPPGSTSKLLGPQIFFVDVLNLRQARWAKISSEFNFKIVYRPVEKSSRADALSRWVDPKLEGEWQKQDLTIQMCKPGQFNLGKSE